MTNDEINALDEDGLRLEVARVLGYRYIRLTSTAENERVKPGTIRERLVNPKNPPVFDNNWEPYWTLEEVPLDRADEIYFLHVPDWPHDIAAAWGLVEEAHMTVYTPQSSLAHGEYVNSDGYMAETQDGQAFYGPAAPIAICRAWLAWKAGR